MKESLEKNNVIRKLEGKNRPYSASRGGLDGPHAVQVMLVWSRVAWRQDTTRRLILDGAAALR